MILQECGFSICSLFVLECVWKIWISGVKGVINTKKEGF